MGAAQHRSHLTWHCDSNWMRADDGPCHQRGANYMGYTANTYLGTFLAFYLDLWCFLFGFRVVVSWHLSTKFFAMLVCLFKIQELLDNIFNVLSFCDFSIFTGLSCYLSCCFNCFGLCRDLLKILRN